MKELLLIEVYQLFVEAYNFVVECGQNWQGSLADLIPTILKLMIVIIFLVR